MSNSIPNRIQSLIYIRFSIYIYIYTYYIYIVNIYISIYIILKKKIDFLVSL